MKLLIRTALTILMLFQVACVNTMQAYIDKNLPGLKPYPIKQALLAHAFSDNSSDNNGYDEMGRTNAQVEYFPREEEERAQRAMNDKTGHVTTWMNNRYGELKFIPGKRYTGTVNGQDRRCREYMVTWQHVGLGIYTNRQNGDACFNPVIKRWTWVEIVD